MSKIHIYNRDVCGRMPPNVVETPLAIKFEFDGSEQPWT
jgi:hypothetical protein